MGEIVITCIDALIHPGWDPISGKFLEKRWEGRVNEIARRPGNILLHFSSKPNMSVPDDLGRYYLKVLNDRYYNLGRDELPNKEDLEILFKSRNKILGTNLKLVVYGEYLQFCVAAWGKHLKEVLQVPWYRYRIREDLSLTCR